MGSVARFWRERTRVQPTLEKEHEGKVVIVLGLPRPALPHGQAPVLEAHGDAPALVVQGVTHHPVAVRTRVERDRVFLILP